jgi:hypothetical protein
MRMANRTFVACATLTASLLITSVAAASPILDDYFLSGTNFPVTFPASTPLTFNAPGDTSYETVTTTEIGVNRLEVFEQLLPAPSPTGADVLRFFFNFRQSPANLNAGFSFTISGLEWDGGPHYFEQSFINVLFGSGSTGIQEATLFTTASTGPDGLTVSFATPAGVSWNSIFGQNVPTALQVDYYITAAPEPSTLLLLFAGGIGVVLSRRQKRA